MIDPFLRIEVLSVVDDLGLRHGPIMPENLNIRTDVLSFTILCFYAI